MSNVRILYPMVALAVLTFIVLLLIPLVRFRAGRRREIRADDFKYGESARVPGWVSIPNRNLMNLLELPMLFYVVCIGFYVTQTADERALALAWAYAALRAGHSAIHLTYNKVYHRLTVYAISNVVLVTLWLRWFVALPG